ncbi:MAG: ATP-binding cassette domain-containing protein, partial [Bacteroidota bacterium]
MIKTNDLAYQYPGSAPIRFPDISVGTNSPLLICGESGCGKTTLLHLLAGLRRPTSGEVIIDDQSVSALAPAALDQYRGKNIGIVYQQAYFVESLSLLDNLLLSPYAKSREKAQDLLTRFGIGDLLHRYPNQLSVGQQQRASIARAVMNEPSVLLADEPTSALDNKNCKLVIELLMEEAKSQDAALVIVTHDDRLRQEIKESIDLA